MTVISFKKWILFFGCSWMDESHGFRSKWVTPKECDPENSNREQGAIFFKSSTYFTEGWMNLHQEAIGHKGSNGFSRGFIPVFLRKPKTTCDFPGGGGGGMDPQSPPPPPADPPMNFELKPWYSSINEHWKKEIISNIFYIFILHKTITDKSLVNDVVSKSGMNVANPYHAG